MRKYQLHSVIKSNILFKALSQVLSKYEGGFLRYVYQSGNENQRIH